MLKYAMQSKQKAPQVLGGFMNELRYTYINTSSFGHSVFMVMLQYGLSIDQLDQLYVNVQI